MRVCVSVCAACLQERVGSQCIEFALIGSLDDIRADITCGGTNRQTHRWACHSPVQLCTRTLLVGASFVHLRDIIKRESSWTNTRSGDRSEYCWCWKSCSNVLFLNNFITQIFQMLRNCLLYSWQWRPFGALLGLLHTFTQYYKSWRGPSKPDTGYRSERCRF